ncbi:MAG: phage tail protein, partial [Clostridiaceae bacterium]|nr:phage tail protein [Clostridiaceae bacterium]
MLKIYDVNKKNSYPLIGYKEYYVESFLKTGDKELSFSIPIQAKYADLIQEEGYVENKDDYFVIKSINKSGDYKVIKAQLDLEELEGKEWEKFESVEQTIDDCLKLAVAGTGWLIKNNGITKKRTIRKSYCSALDVIQQARKTYRVEFEFDTKNKIINIYEKLGANKGSFLMDSLNLKKLEEQGNTYDFYTRMIAIGATDERGNTLKTTVTN